MGTTLLDGEKIITESGDKSIVLTNYRLRRHISGGGHAHIVSIMLGHISNIEVRYKSYLLMLIVGVLLLPIGAMAALGTGEPTAGVPVSLLGLILIIIYFVTRKHVISIYADSGRSIDFATKGLKRDAILKFVNQIEDAKLNWLQSSGISHVEK